MNDPLRVEDLLVEHLCGLQGSLESEKKSLIGDLGVN